MSDPIVQISSKHCHSQTGRDRELKFWENIDPTLCVMCHVSCVMCHVSHVMCHVSRVMCHMSHVTCHVSHVTCHMAQINRVNKIHRIHVIILKFLELWFSLNGLCVEFNLLSQVTNVNSSPKIFYQLTTPGCPGRTIPTFQNSKKINF